MNEDSGFIKIHRKFLNWEWYEDTNTKILFIHCLLKANWKAGNFQGENISRGSFATSLTQLSKELALSIQQARTSLSKLITTGELTSFSTSKFRIITVNNYELYQTVNKQNNSEITSNQQAEQQQNNNNRRNKEDISNSSSKEINARVYEYYEKNFGIITPIEKEGLDIWLNEFSEEIVKYAIKTSVLANVKNFKYIDGILKNWKTNNFKTLENCKPKEKKEDDKPVELFDYNWLEEESEENGNSEMSSM